MAQDDGLRALIRSYIKGPQWVSMETGHTEQGVPDMNCIWKGFDTWIECKAVKANSIKFQPNQIGWIETRVRHGGRCLVAVRHHRSGGGRLLPEDTLYVFDGEYVEELNEVGIRHTKGLLLKTTGGPSAWRWSGLKWLLEHGRSEWLS